MKRDKSIRKPSINNYAENFHRNDSVTFINIVNELSTLRPIYKFYLM